MTYSYKGFSITGQLSYVEDTYSDANNTVTSTANAQNGLIPSYTITDLTVGCKIVKTVNIKAGINNLTNERYFIRRAGCLWYDATTARWRIWKTNITGLTSNGTTITGTLPTALTSTLAVTGALTASSTASIASTTTVGGAFDFKYVLTPSSGSGSLILGDTGSSNYIRHTETGGLGSGLLELNGAEVEIVGGSVLINGAVPLYSTNLLTKYLATTATYNNTAALANTALSVTVVTGTKCAIELTVYSDSAVKALNMDFGGTSTQSSFIGQWEAHRDTVVGTNGTARVTSAGRRFILESNSCKINTP